jgi:sodium transport system permease protein
LPVVVQDIDVSTPTSRAAFALGILSYLVIFAMLFGGLYLAIDTTAGERERGSLESLLTVPAERSHLIYGKILATLAYMTISLILTVVGCAFTLQFTSLEEFGMTVSLDALTCLKIIAVSVPLALVGAGLLTVVASFTKSFREAQSYLSIAISIPTLPLAFVGILRLEPSILLMATPSLGQHLLITQIVRGEPLMIENVLTSASVSVALGLLLCWIAGRLYDREAILG